MNIHETSKAVVFGLSLPFLLLADVAPEARAECGYTRAAGTPAPSAERTSASLVERNRLAASGRR